MLSRQLLQRRGLGFQHPSDTDHREHQKQENDYQTKDQDNACHRTFKDALLLFNHERKWLCTRSSVAIIRVHSKCVNTTVQIRINGLQHIVTVQFGRIGLKSFQPVLHLDIRPVCIGKYRKINCHLRCITFDHKTIIQIIKFIGSSININPCNLNNRLHFVVPDMFRI